MQCIYIYIYIYIKIYRVQIEFYNRIPSIRNESEKKTNAPELLQAYITWVVAFLKRTIFPKIVFSYFYLVCIISYLRNFNQFDILHFGRRYWCIGLKMRVYVCVVLVCLKIFFMAEKMFQF